jgi:hypothetical protein
MAAASPFSCVAGVKKGDIAMSPVPDWIDWIG